jgi:cob(I)alamin adenosyltransferase
MPKIYTKTGDKGETSLIGGQRVKKSDIIVEAYGTIDELNSFIGLLKDKYYRFSDVLERIQNNLFIIETIVASGEGSEKRNLPITKEEEIYFLEQQIDFMTDQLPPLKNFILPGGHEAVSVCHICRTVTRRAERAMLRTENYNDIALKYINRLSDYFFTLSRFIAKDYGARDVIWKSV